jgi:hypothetical protein
MIKSIVRLAAGVALMGLISCSHGELSPQLDLEKIPQGATGLILPITLTGPQGVVSQDGCRVDLRQTGSVKDYPITVRTGTQAIFAQVPEGTYSFFDLFCGKNQTWDFASKKWAAMIVVQGKISFAAPMAYNLNKNGGMTTYFSNRNAVQKTLRDSFARIAPETQTGLISAYNKKVITAKMIKQTQYQITVKLPPKHAKEGEPDEANYPDFKPCYLEEFPINPLYVGYMSLVAEYNNKLLAKLSLKENKSAYSDQFYTCVQNKLKQFVPNRSDDLNYEIVL